MKWRYSNPPFIGTLDREETWKVIRSKMLYSDLKSMLREYNWDDGFEVPKEILSDSNCDLALALEIFYLADGYSYLEKSDKTAVFQNWNPFITTLYRDILNHKFRKTDTPFTNPLNEVQKYRFRKKQVPEIFLTDL